MESRALWQDWVTIWQSEIAALATDRETQEMLQRAIDVWAAQALAVGPDGDAAGRAGPIPAPGAAPFAAAPGFPGPAFEQWFAGLFPPVGPPARR